MFNRILRLFLCRFGPITILAGSLSACLITPPVRVKTSVKTTSEQKHALPKSLPRVGETGRNEVEEQYRAFAVDSGVPNLFLARFRKSSWAMAGGVYYMGGGTARFWSTQDLLVVFDENNLAKTVEVFPDKELERRILRMHRASVFKSLDLDKPSYLNVQGPFSSEPTPVELTSSNFSMTTRNALFVNREITLPAESFSVPLAQIDAVTLDGSEDLGPRLYILVRFSEKSRVGKTVRFSTAPGDALKCIRWFDQAKAQQR